MGPHPARATLAVQDGVSRAVPGDGEQPYEVSAAGINFADTHQRASCDRAHSVSPYAVSREFLPLLRRTP